MENYWCHPLGEKFDGFGVGISGYRRSLKGPLLLSDLDPPNANNLTLSNTNDPKWFLVPLRIVGP